jgi:hypothetical protein
VIHLQAWEQRCGIEPLGRGDALPARGSGRPDLHRRLGRDQHPAELSAFGGDVVITDSVDGEAGVVPGGAGAAVTGDALGRYAELEQPLGSGKSTARDKDRLDAAIRKSAHTP